MISRSFYLNYCYYNTSMEKSIYKKARAKIEFSICESPCPWWHRPRKCWNHVRPKPICCRRRKRKQRGSNHLPEIWRKKFSESLFKNTYLKNVLSFHEKIHRRIYLKLYLSCLFYSHEYCLKIQPSLGWISYCFPRLWHSVWVHNLSNIRKKLWLCIR